MTIAVPLSLDGAIFPTPEVTDGNGFVLPEPQGLLIETSNSYAYAGSLAYTGVDFRVDNAIADSTKGTPAVVASAMLKDVFLPAGSSITLNYQFVPSDLTQNDVAFVILEGSNNNETVDLIGNSAQVAADPNPALFTTTLPVLLTDTYRIILVVGNADNLSYTSYLSVSGITLNLPDASLLTGSGLSLGGDYAIDTSGALTQNGFLVKSGYASAAGANNVAGLIAQGGGNVGPDGGNLVASGGGNLVASGGGNLVASGGGNLVASGGGNIGTNANALISQDGGGVVYQNVNGLVASGGGNLVASGGGNALGSPDAVVLGTAPANTATSMAATGLVPELPRTYSTLTVTLPPGASASSAPTLTAGADSAPTVFNAYVRSETPRVAALSNGGYVVVWFSTNNGQILGQIFNPDGTTAGAQFVANPNATYTKGPPTVAGLANGSFVVGWSATSVATGYSLVRAQIVNADGTLNGGAIAISPADSASYSQPSFASVGSGGFVAVLNAQPRYNTFPVAQLFDATGAPVGTAVQIPLPVGSATQSTFSNPVLTELPTGGFAIVFSLQQFGNTTAYGTYIDLFDQNGIATAGPIQVNPAGEGLQALPAVAALTNGNIVVSWLDETNRNASQPLAELRLQVVSLSGVLVGVPIDVGPAGAADPPAITALANGGFSVAWDAFNFANGNYNGPSSATIQVALFNADGSQVTTLTVADSHEQHAASPSLATLPNQTVIMASAQGYFDIHAQAFSLSGPPVSAAPQQGVAVDGYISGATVFADAKGTGVLAPGDVSTTTNAKGQFTLPAGAVGPLVMTGGTDTSTGLAFTQTYTAPAGSHSITALSTVVQKLMATGASLGTAEAKVSAAFGLSGLTDLTALDPVASVKANQGNGLYLLLTDAVVADTMKLATAAGASGDLFGKLAAEIAAQPYKAIDPTSVASMQALGLSGQVASDTATLARASATALVKSLSADTGTLSKLIADTAAVETVAQGRTTAALARTAAAGNTSAIVPTFTGANLNAIVGATQATQAGNPPDISETDAVTGAVGYSATNAYTGPVTGLQHQYIWSGPDAVAVASHVPNTFLKGGAGGDALTVAGGSNVLDGGGGSNFLTGGPGGDGGTDTFFVDGRGAVVTWSTIINFHPGDAATIFGFHAGVSTMPMSASDGVPGYTGLTIHSELAGTGTGVNASMTFAGITQATSDAHFSYTTGTLGAGTAKATDYLLIQYNR